MPIVLANLLRVLTIGSLGYSFGDLVNWFQRKKAGAVEPVGETLRKVFLSPRFFVFMIVIVLGFYLLLQDRFKRR